MLVPRCAFSISITEMIRRHLERCSKLCVAARKLGREHTEGLSRITERKPMRRSLLSAPGSILVQPREALGEIECPPQPLTQRLTDHCRTLGRLDQTPIP